MTVCEICESESFENRDGLFFCLDCGTQSQNVREEMLADKEFEANQRLAIKKKRKPGQSQGYARAKGKPWVMHEAFQIIIKAQVEYLVKLGVNPQLKEVVGQIWFGYLRATRIAFCANPRTPSHLPSLRKTATKTAPSKSMKKKNWKKDGYDSNDELPELSSEFGEETFYPGDNPSGAQALDEQQPVEDDSDVNVDDDDDDDDDDNDDDDESVGSFRTSNKKKTPLLHMTMAFCYLGLLWLDEPIFLSDLIRWAKEGSFPYFQASRLLPDYMKLGGKDSRILTVMAVPERKTILEDALCIMKLQKLPRFPDRDLTIYTARYILELNLPEILHGFVRKLLSIFKPRQNTAKLAVTPHYEVTAMAYIILAMKLCYGLDDTDHKKQEELSKQFDENESKHNSLPVFMDWASCVRQCQSKKQACGVPWTDEEVRQTRDPRAYGTFCKTDIFGSWAFRDLEMVEGRRSIVGPKRKWARQEYKESCAEIFSSLVPGLNRSDDQQATTSFPLTCRHNTNLVANEHCSHCFDAIDRRRIPKENLDQLCGGSVCDRQDEEEDESATDFRRYIRHLRLDNNGDTRHPSYQFLLRLLSTRIESTPDDLENVMAKLETSMCANSSIRLRF